MTKYIVFIKNAIILTLFFILSIIAIIIVYNSMKERIEKQSNNFLTKTLNELLPENQYDNVLLATCYIPLETNSIKGIYVAKKNKQVINYVIISITEGYSNDITILSVINKYGDILGIRILDQSETPGLGDKIVTTNWVDIFKGINIKEAAKSNWAVKKDGGRFDQFTGATITPRAIVEELKLDFNLVINKLIENPNYIRNMKSCGAK